MSESSNSGPENPSHQLNLFATGKENEIPGEVVIKLRQEAASAAGRNRPRLSGAFGRHQTIGIPSVDGILLEIGAKSIRPLHPLPLRRTSGARIFAGQSIEPAADYLRVQFDETLTVREVRDRLRGLDEVAMAEPNRWRETFASGPSGVLHDERQWGLDRIGCPSAWNRTTGKNDVVVAVVDTGIDLDHTDLAPMLKGANFVNLGEHETAEDGWIFEGNLRNRAAPPEDEVGHGTHVAGIICCDPRNSASHTAGVTWNCRLLPVRVLACMRRLHDNLITGAGNSTDIAEGIWWATDHGAKVINLSLGSYEPTPWEEDAIERAIQKDVVVVAAMGNDGLEFPCYPAAYQGVVAVGAVDSDDSPALFSNYGSHLSLCAPGVNIWSTFLGNSHMSLDGTSMAAPHVAGVAALVRSCNPGLSAPEVVQVLCDTATQPTPEAALPSGGLGSGIVNADGALKASGC